MLFFFINLIISLLLDSNIHEFIFQINESSHYFAIINHTDITVIFPNLNGVITEIYELTNQDYSYKGSVGDVSNSFGFHGGENYFIIKFIPTYRTNVTFYYYRDAGSCHSTFISLNEQDEIFDFFPSSKNNQDFVCLHQIHTLNGSSKALFLGFQKIELTSRECYKQNLTNNMNYFPFNGSYSIKALLPTDRNSSFHYQTMTNEKSYIGPYSFKYPYSRKSFFLSTKSKTIAHIPILEHSLQFNKNLHLQLDLPKYLYSTNNTFTLIDENSENKHLPKNETLKFGDSEEPKRQSHSFEFAVNNLRTPMKTRSYEIRKEETKQNSLVTQMSHPIHTENRSHEISVTHNCTKYRLKDNQITFPGELNQENGVTKYSLLVITVIFGVLLVLSLIAGIFFWKKSHTRFEDVYINIGQLDEDLQQLVQEEFHFIQT